MTPSRTTPESTRSDAPDALGSYAAPLQIKLRFHVQIPSREAFDLVAIRLPEWFGRIREIRWDNTASERGPSQVGACSSRACSIDGKVVHEEIVSFKPGRSYAYRADMRRSTMKMPIRDHLGTFDVEDDDGGCTVTWRQYFRAPIWPLGAVIRWYMRDRLMRPAVKGLISKVGGQMRSVGR